MYKSKDGTWRWSPNADPYRFATETSANGYARTGQERINYRFPEGTRIKAGGKINIRFHTTDPSR